MNVPQCAHAVCSSVFKTSAYTQDVSQEQFLNDPQIQDAVCRRLEIPSILSK